MHASFKRQAVVPEEDLGTSADRLHFVEHLRDRGFSLQELASMSYHGLDTVKAWFSKNPARKREVSARAVALLMQHTGYSLTSYKAAVKQRAAQR